MKSGYAVIAIAALLVGSGWAIGAEDEAGKSAGGFGGLDLGREDPGMGSLAARALGSLLVVLVVAAGSLLAVRRLMRGSAVGGRGRMVQVLETAGLGKGKAVHLVQVGSRRYLIGAGADNVRLLGDVTDAGVTAAETAGEDDEAGEGRGEGTFRGVLRRLVSGGSN